MRDSVEFDKYSHNGFLWGEMGVKVFDGTEAFVLYMDGMGAIYKTYTWTGGFPSITSVNVRCFSTHFIGKNRDQIFDGHIGISVSSNNVRVSQIDNFPTVSDFKAFLAAQHSAGTPVTVVYQLATPTRTPLTFTLNNSSTFPECPMEPLTSVPSAEYPAELWDAEGSVSVRGKNLFDMSLSSRYDAVRKCLVATSYAQNTGVKLKTFLHEKSSCGRHRCVVRNNDRPNKNDNLSWRAACRHVEFRDVKNANRKYAGI